MNIGKVLKNVGKSTWRVVEGVVAIVTVGKVALDAGKKKPTAEPDKPSQP